MTKSGLASDDLIFLAQYPVQALPGLMRPLLSRQLSQADIFPLRTPTIVPLEARVSHP